MKKTKLKGKIAKAKGKIKKSVKKAVSVMGKTMKFAVLAPLLPLKVAMGVLLKKRGVTPKKEIQELIPQFYKIVIKKESVSFDIDPVTISLIVGMMPPIIDFFKKMKEKKNKGGKLTKEEEEALASAEKVAEAISEVGGEKSDEKKGFDFTKYLPVLLIGVVAIWFFTKK